VCTALPPRYLPLSNRQAGPSYANEDPSERLCPALDHIVPADEHEAYNMHIVIDAIVDSGQFFEIHKGKTMAAATAKTALMNAVALCK
jgi:acetyl-CoA carboxylase carboxyltransferase component